MEMRFGWDGDDGLGHRLIQQVLAGRKTATCAPRVLYEAHELPALRAAVGDVLPLTDKDDHVHGHVRLVDVFETTYGAPDERLWRGEGYESAAAFQASHRTVWDPFFPDGVRLTEDTVLVVEIFRLEKNE